MSKALRCLCPILATLIILIIPVPRGLEPHAWRFFAIFLGCIVGLILEPLPGGAIGLIGISVAALFGPYVLFSSEELAQPGFKPTINAFEWAVSGFSNPTVWLIFGAFTFALAYDKTGLGKRIALLLVRSLGKNTLALGYAITFTDTILAPFTISSTARSAGIIYPVLSHLPPLYNSRPFDSSRKKIGTYLMWTGIVSTSITSSFFMTALAPNLLSINMANKIIGINITWMEWFMVTLPACFVLITISPLLSYHLCKPEIKSSTAIPTWANKELQLLGSLTAKEMLLIFFVTCALLLWILGGKFITPPLVGIVVVSAMLISQLLTWNDIVENKAAWNIFTWLATLIAFASGLNKSGFINWFGQLISVYIIHFSPLAAMILLLCIYYSLHYFFASNTAHAAALLPIFLGTASHIPGINIHHYVLLILPLLGFMGIVTPYAAEPSAVYYGSGFIPNSVWWRLGFIFGLLFLITWLFISIPWVLMIS
ncbi:MULTISPECIES: DASS family sodium-coupled anion symporter [unclassified Commensalibacter]|uniref:DASS family sodium-coupled anion symporter n=1 Tax=unclassified Commensalibacter TaxID=2630218 RepID=UPI0018DCE297|nr:MULTISPECIES: DASS family sodium-coupled anion symporter [unclassified Commensalibacter]MBH9970650.1 DASS family sodium-coupled anion symporter [Commensalibacter sp. M0265]MBH9978024.1 DASS family sodium-coupled anion symporter [Commensalibacter sp. M0266]MBH9993704.1 DASS family sodium-coupled anion symporter [Commensalibacter sp. M0270]MBI0047200.1 DASS family sodium-coupled anion symporter [Commensalibacter sp. M0267]MBI0056869.1 DASS family sodium-coupled anion symporter [Commensalibact